MRDDVKQIQNKNIFPVAGQKIPGKKCPIAGKNKQKQTKVLFRTKKRICPVAGQQAELQRVLCDDEQKEAAVDFGLPGGEVFKDKSTSMSCK